MAATDNLRPNTVTVDLRALREHLKRGRSAAAAAACACVAAGCGTQTLDMSRASHQIRHLLTTQAGLTVKAVKCPSNVRVGKGVVVKCTATLDNGHTVRMSITQTDDKGDVHIGQDEMIADELQNFINRRFAAKGVQTTTVCPQHEPVLVGTTFSCTTTDNSGHTVRVQIKVHTPAGDFTATVVSSG